MNRDEVKKLAYLARLSVGKEEIDRLGGSLSGILDFFERLDAAELEAVEPLAHPLDIGQRLRPDAVAEEDRRERFQAIAPHSRDGYYLVPKVID